MVIIKFAVWGLGVRGRTLIRTLEEKVSCIIEEKRELYNTFYGDIPVVSLETYMDFYSDCPVIVTPMNDEDEIVRLLKEKDMEAFRYNDSIMLSELFWTETPIENSLKNLDKKKETIVYGAGLLGYLLFNYLQCNNYMCSIAMQHDYHGNISLKDGKTVWTKEAAEDAQVLLTLPLSGRDFSETKDISQNFEKYYETIEQRELYFRPELSRFKNIHDGKRCFIVATGPSLKIEDLDTLYQNGEICFSVNGIFPAFGKTMWKPHYYMVSDPDAVLKWEKDILETDIEEKFIASRAWVFEGTRIKEKMNQWHVFRIVEEGKKPQFSDDFARGTFTGKTVVYDGALQLAVYMGFKQIYLLGVDCSYAKGGKNNYFFEEQKQDMLNHHENEMILAYQSAKDYADTHDIKIYNATRGGMLEVFERVDFDSLFNMSK